MVDLARVLCAPAAGRLDRHRNKRSIVFCNHPSSAPTSWRRLRQPPPLSASAAAASGPSSSPEQPAHQPTGDSSTCTPDTLGSMASLALRASAQLAVLAAALAALILLPANLSGRLATQPLQAAANFGIYLAFFASGTISRMLLHGRLAPAKQDAQRSSGRARATLVLFAGVAVPAGHFAAWFDGSLAAAAAAASGGSAAAAVFSAAARLLPAAGYALMLAGWALNAAAAAQLGKAYNRVVAPNALVTTGVFAFVQHPIYTSYMLLFVGHCLSLGSPAAAAGLLAACLAYYRGRVGLEEQVLEAAFGGEYRAYRSTTGRFLPRVRL